MRARSRKNGLLQFYHFYRTSLRVDLQRQSERRNRECFVDVAIAAISCHFFVEQPRSCFSEGRPRYRDFSTLHIGDCTPRPTTLSVRTIVLSSPTRLCFILM